MAILNLNEYKSPWLDSATGESLLYSLGQEVGVDEVLWSPRGSFGCDKMLLCGEDNGESVKIHLTACLPGLRGAFHFAGVNDEFPSSLKFALGRLSLPELDIKGSVEVLDRSLALHDSVCHSG